MTAPSLMQTPPQLARHYTVSPDKVLSWIDAGELRAVDVRSPGSARPRWRISPDAIAEFEARRAATPPPKSRPRRKRQEGITEYF